MEGTNIFYRRKYYIVKNEFVDTFNKHFNETNLPNQLSYGSRLIGRWMIANDDNTTEIFAIWEYDDYETYIEIEDKIKADVNHVNKIKKWYDENGGREHVLSKYILQVKNEKLISTVTNSL